MNSESLATFFASQNAATLNECDREQVHLSGMIQSFGALLILSSETGEITAWSANALEMFNLSGPNVSELATNCPDLADAITAHLGQETNLAEHQLLEYQHKYREIEYVVSLTRTSNQVLIELIQAGSLTPQGLRQKLRTLREGCSRIFKEPDLQTALQIATETAKEIIGFARVKIYQFQPDWSGAVVAEAREPHMESFLGLHFPDTDIPKQARELFTIVPYRLVASAEDDTIDLEFKDGKTPDLSRSHLRSVSRMHTQYLRNMGVSSTFSVAILHNGKLWGMIACHHDKPGVVPIDLWEVMHDVAMAISERVSQFAGEDQARMMAELRAIESSVAQDLREEGSIDDALRKVVPILCNFLNADGFAFQYGKRIFSHGSIPPVGFISELLDWLKGQADSDIQFETTSLHKLWPPALDHMDVACGVLVQPVKVHTTCKLIWFRAPKIESVHWAGDPSKEGVTNEEPLTPRNSFAVWTKEQRDQSSPWTAGEIESAKEILKEVLDIIATQIALKEHNKSLQTFAYSAAHDIKSPLRTIGFALDILTEDPEVAQHPTVVEALEIAEGSSSRLSALIDQLTQNSLLENIGAPHRDVDLMAVFNDVRSMLVGPIKHAGATLFEPESLPVVTGRPELLTTLFLNLMGNSIKYREKTRPLEIRIAAEMVGNCAVLRFRDNGIGLPVEHAEKAFEPFKRLVGESIAEGSGLGLSICRRIIEEHHGKINVNIEHPGPGTEIVVQIPNKIALLQT